MSLDLWEKKSQVADAVLSLHFECHPGPDLPWVFPSVFYLES